MQGPVRFRTVAGAAALCVGLAAGTTLGQSHMPGANEARNDPSMQPGNVMSMSQMMDNMQQVMGMMSGMMGGNQAMGQQEMGMGHGQGMMQGQGSMQGQGGMPSQGSMMGMMWSVNGLTNSMNQVMQHMQAMMDNHGLMGNMEVSKGLQQMQGEMSTMMHGLDGMVNTLHQMRGQPGKQR